MSTKRRSQNSNDDNYSLKWADVEVDIESASTISSEENSGECDGEQRTRARPSGEIWEVEKIWDSLLTLEDAEEINEIIHTDNIRNILKTNINTALLLACWLRKPNVLTFILETGAANLVTFDPDGRSAMHLAAYAGSVDCLRLLIDAGMDVDQWDSSKQLTAMHCAAAVGHLPCLRLLIKYGADINAGLNIKSPLYYAVQSSAVACVKELLENKAIPNTPQVFSETPLHIAASLGNTELVGLLIAYGAAVNVQYGSEKMTPLHLAAEDGDTECAKVLIEAGAILSSRNHKKQTPLHLAALSQCPEAIELLLGKGADPNATDTDGRTPLHCAIVKVNRSCECVKLLLDHRANVNVADVFGYTPLHLAALNEYSHCVMMLINNGGDVTARTNGGISVLNFITRKTPDVIPKYIAKFDNSIKLADHELGDVDCELKLDFRVLVPTVGNKETELLLNFIEVGYKEILKHPLSETFLFLKWRRIRKFFLFSLMYHSVFVCLFTLYIINVFLKNCPSAKSLGPSVCWVPNAVRNVGYVILVLNTVILAKELFQIAHSWLSYVKQWENWLQCLIIITVFLCVQPKANMNVEQDVYAWQHHIAAISIFLTWLELMMIVGRFPIFGLYIQMFTRVFVNFAKFMGAYFCLFLAFTLSFGVIFANYPSFKQLHWVLVKVIIMMSGELEYEDVFFPENQEFQIMYPITAQLMYFCFVILVTLILNNLLVGLAVSDIQGLQESAGLDRIVRQAELVAHLESMLFSRLLTWVPHKLMKFLLNQALLLKSQYYWALYIRPNDPREARIPRELIQNIYQLVVQKKERPRSKKKKYKTDCCEYESTSLSRKGSYLSDRNQNYRSQVEELYRDFQEFNRTFKQKLDKFSNQLT